MRLPIFFAFAALILSACQPQPPAPPAEPHADREEPNLRPAPLTPDQARAALGPLVPTVLDGPAPNVLFIVFDDLNDYLLDDRHGVRMPNLRRFLDSSVSFRRAYANIPACNPSRASFLSGISPERSGVIRNDAKLAEAPLLNHCVFLPEAFRAAGYATFTTGKIFHGKGIRPADDRFGAMWDTDERRLGRVPEPTTPPQLPSEIGDKELVWGAFPDAEFHHRDDSMAAAAAAWLQARSGQAAPPGSEFAYPAAPATDRRPFFCSVGFTLPHLPWLVPQSLLDAQVSPPDLPQTPAEDWDDLPPYAVVHAQKPVPWLPLKDAGLAPEMFRHYLAACELADRNFGELLAALDASPLAENTVVILFSDHGYHLGEHHSFSKFQLFEQTLRVPLAIRLPPSSQPAPQKIDQPVSLLDLYPTLRDLCGLSVPQNQLDGRSLLPLLRRPNPATDSTQASFDDSGASAHPAPLAWYEDGQSLRTPQYRYTRWRDGREELYHHPTDPQEFTNLAPAKDTEATDPAIRAALTELRELFDQRRRELGRK